MIEKERQLELAYQAERSYDVFRNGESLTRHYPGPQNAMEDIPATEYRVTYFIPQIDVAYPFLYFSGSLYHTLPYRH